MESRIVVLDGYHQSDDVARIAGELIAAHQRFADLADFEIIYAELHGKEPDNGTIHAIAKAVKAPKIWNDLKSVDGVVWVNHRWWTTADERSRRAIVAHELCHFYQDDKGRLAVAEHDIEEFAFVVREFGPWSAPVAQLQLALADGPST